MEARPSSILKHSPTECSLGGDHEGQFLTTVCMEAACRWKLCCAVCQHESHLNHKTQPLKMFLKQVAANTQLVPRDSDKTMIDETIAQAKQKSQQTLSVQRRALNALFEKLEKAMEEELTMMEKKLNFMSINADQLSMQLLDIKDQAELQSLIDNIVQSGLNSERTPQPKLILRQLTNKQLEILKEFSQHTDQLFFMLERLVSRVTQLHKVQAKSSPIRFSEGHKDIQIVDRKVQLAGKTSCFKLVLADPPLQANSVEKFKFRLSSSSVGVGVCLANKLKVEGYTIQNYSVNGHGFWGMYGSKLVYSHSNEEHNYKQLAFELDCKLPLEMEVDRMKNQIRYWQGGNSYTLLINADSKDIVKLALMMVQSGTSVEYLDE